MKKGKKTHRMSIFLDVFALVLLILAIITFLTPIPVGIFLLVFGFILFGARFRKVLNIVAKIFNFDRSKVFKEVMKEEKKLEKTIRGKTK